MKTSADARPGQVAFYRIGIPIYYSKAPKNNNFALPVSISKKEANLFNTDESTEPEIQRLKRYLTRINQPLGVKAKVKIQLRLVSVMTGDTQQFVRFRQVVSTKFGTDFPIEGASVVVVLEKGKIKIINTSLKSPPKKKDFVETYKLGILISDQEDLEYFSAKINQFKNKDAFLNAIDSLQERGTNKSLNLAGPNFDKNKLSQAFKNLSSRSIFRFILLLAKKGNISFVHYGKEKKAKSHWVFKVRDPYQLPVEFDITIPEGENDQMIAKNFRSSYNHIVAEEFDTEAYPLDGNERNLGDSTPTLEILKNVYKYFAETFSWIGRSGQNDPDEKVTVYSGITRYVMLGRAFWSENDKAFLIGADGKGYKNKNKSTSILSHEYTHGVITATSGLVYSNQPGALNEHIADLQGALARARLTKKKFRYVIGDEDIFEDEKLAKVKEKIATVLPNPVENEAKFQLRVPALRNLFDPRVSSHKQQSTYAEALAAYGPNCEPAGGNGRCGVHSQSGVLNRAMSIAISKLGVDKIEEVFFNTYTRRLTSSSDFANYGYQLIEECLEQAAVQKNGLTLDNCQTIEDSFKAVGIPLGEAS